MVLGRLAEPVVAFAFLGDSMSSLDMRFFIEVKLLFEYLLHFGFGFNLSQVSASSSRMPSIPEYFSFYFDSPAGLIYNLFSVIIFEGTAHHFNLFFDFMYSA